MPEPQRVVRVRGLSKTYEEAGTPHAVLRDVSLDVEEGACVALLGRSGSGKSTLLNLIAGIDEADEGNVEVAGRSITTMSDRERTLFRRGSIGFVYQFFNLIATLSVLDNVKLPLDLAEVGADAADIAREMLAHVGLAGRERSYPDRLSGGEQQRVAIARALAASPLLVLADEPTGNLDADTGDTILRLLLGLTRSRGRTLIVATHSRAVAAEADTVLRVEDGRLVPVDLRAAADADLLAESAIQPAS